MLEEPAPEFLTQRDKAKAYFIEQLKKATNEMEVKLTCRALANLIGPRVFGPMWVIDSKAITKFMWSTHSKTQMAFVFGVISFLPEVDNGTEQKV